MSTHDNNARPKGPVSFTAEEMAMITHGLREQVPVFLTHKEVALVYAGLSALDTGLRAGTKTCGTLADIERCLGRIMFQVYGQNGDFPNPDAATTT